MRRRRAAAEPRIRRGAAQGHGDADRVVRRQREVLRGVRRERFDLGVRQRTRRVVEPVGGVGSRYVARRGLVQELRGRQRRRPRLSKERVVALGQDAADVELFLERGERFFVFCGAVPVRNGLDPYPRGARRGYSVGRCRGRDATYIVCAATKEIVRWRAATPRQLQRSSAGARGDAASLARIVRGRGDVSAEYPRRGRGVATRLRSIRAAKVRDAQFRASELRDEIRRRVFEVGHEHAAGREAAPRDDARRRGGSTLELLERQRQRFALRDERDRRRPTPRGGRRELVEGHMIELAQGCVSGLCSREPT